VEAFTEQNSSPHTPGEFGGCLLLLLSRMLAFGSSEYGPREGHEPSQNACPNRAFEVS
jgi:hypothetical protein